ncbi:alpha-2-macroglobulin-P [Manduca sexta]|uniref:alpha-2-macroglobulin-P n=1 Tax=Manduca sexta TaxID=7130 RepID=UPI00188EC7C5|nr:alpha-2-macroglobulin-P [Manduca sexta]
MVLINMFRLIWIFCLCITNAVASPYINETLVPRNIISTPCTDKNHLFLVPGVLTAGGTNRACISRFYPEGVAHLLLILETEDRQVVTASRELPAGDGGCLDMSVPLLPNTKAELTVSLRYPEAQCSWERRLTVRISSGRVVLVQTERARYRPGDTLRVRVLAFKADLTPSHGIIDEVWVEGARGAWDGTRVTQWSRVHTRQGIAQLQYDLDELAPPGRWTVRASLADGSQGSATFWVGNYDLPPFQLSVRHAPRVLRTSERLVWTVCVRYPWAEAVEGMLVIRLRGAGSPDSSGIRTVTKLRGPQACHRHAAAARRVGLLGVNPPDVIIADFSFQEDGTRIWQNTTVVSRVVDKPVTLEFLTKHRAVVSPGLPHKLKVKATRWDDKPASSQKIVVCRHRAEPATPRAAVTCATADTDDSGVAKVMFPPGDDDATLYRFEASLSNDTSTTATALTLPVQRAAGAHAALGPLKADSRAARTIVPLYLHMPNVTTAVTVHFVVITRGGIIYRWGATTQCPITTSATEAQTASRNSKCLTNIANDRYVVSTPQNDSDSLLDRHLPRVMLPIKVTHQMCPDSHMVAYFYYNGQLVSASKHFEMEECFANKVEAAWLSRQVLPGSIASLRVKTSGPALCALTVLDTASKWVQPLPNIKEEVMRSLKRLIDSHRNLTGYDAAGDCFLTMDALELPTNSRELMTTWLATAGVRVLGGEVPTTRHCVPAPLPLIDDSNMLRTDFSEAWLWRLLAVDGNKTAIANTRTPDSITRFEAGVLCVSRNGIGVAPPAVLQVFREFFIHADSPRRLRRGDSAIVRFRLFNYLYEPLNVQILVLTDKHIEGPAQRVETVCIPARTAIARRTEIWARLAGQGALNLRAVVAHDGLCGKGTARNVSDEVAIPIIIDPEGVPVKEHKSVLLCGTGDKDFRKSEVSWTWPTVPTVPGTESLTIWTSSDAAGPLYADADSLVLLPRGCGEQNMARLATNLLALTQLDPRSAAATTAREHVARGFTRQLQYLHPGGGFSAFGPSDQTPSTWLTAFVVRYLRRAHQALWPSLPAPPAVDRAERWLISQQMENGCFRNEGHVFHRELKGGLNEDGEIASVALTAYVITSLVESASPLPYSVIRNSLACLRALPPMKTKNPNRVYAHALLAYAFMRLKRYEEELRKTNEASFMWEMRRSVGGGLRKDEELKEVMELMNMAKRNEDYVWWETSSLSTTIEATSYALLSLAQEALVPRAPAAAALRWLAAHRADTGGFLTTQDTLVALEAITAWSPSQPRANLTVTAYSYGITRSARLIDGAKVPELLKMGTGDKLHVAVEGTGCALMQATRSYHSLWSAPAEGKSLLVQVTVTTDGTFDCDASGVYCACAAVIETCVVWNSAFPEMALLEVTLPGDFAPDAALLYAQLHKRDTLLRRIELTPANSSKMTLYLGAKGGAAPPDAGHQCYSVHAVGSRARTKPGYVRLHDYYRPAVNDTQAYTIPEDCPTKISHETNEYTASDNLFTKAKSPSDSSEILISQEIPYEDTPGWVPLEDPLYENLTLRRKGDNNKDFIKTVKSNASNSTVKDIKEDKIEVKRDGKYVDSEKRDSKDKLGNDKIIKTNEYTDSVKSVAVSDTVDMNLKSVVNKLKTNQNDNEKEILSRTKDSKNKLDLQIQESKKKEHSITTRDEHKDQNGSIDNPNLTDFHVIDSEKDLEVPSGIEGPIPAVVLPPQNFVPPKTQPQNVRSMEFQPHFLPETQPHSFMSTELKPPPLRFPNMQPQRPDPRMYHGYYPGMYYLPLNYDNYRRYITPTG